MTISKTFDAHKNTNSIGFPANGPDQPHTLTIHPIPAFDDNYLWCISDTQDNTGNRAAYVVDPGDAQAVLNYMQQHGLVLAGILVTHHHYDHTDGIPTLLQHFPNLPVFGPHNSPCQHINQPVQAKDTVTLLGHTFQVLETPGHTLDHIAYYSQAQRVLFCGDTLFKGGCGRVFEGTMPQMLASLEQLGQLPENTLVYPAHEYTLANLAFANAVEPNNKAIQDTIHACQKLRQQGIPTLPTSIAQEHNTNPFLRCAQPEVTAAACAYWQQPANEDKCQVFTYLRQWKNNF